MTSLITILALGFIIFIHELGHMLAAKRAGVGVFEFSIGMGPAVVSKQFGETLYSLRIFPFGGFVKLAGMDESEDSVEDRFNYQLKPWYSRMSIIAAGAVFNVVFGFFVFVMIFWGLGSRQVVPVVKSVIENSVAFEAGLRSGDAIVAVNGQPVKDVQKDVVMRIRESNGAEVRVSVKRDGGVLDIGMVPVLSATSVYQVGVMFDSQVERFGFFRSIGAGATATVGVVKGVFSSIALLVTGTVGLKEMSGPLGIVQFASHGLERGVADFFGVVALISISLGVFNLLPLPVLDGGHLVFLGIEAVRGRPISRKYMMWIERVGIAFLLSLMAFVIFNDVVNWGNRADLLKSFFK